MHYPETLWKTSFWLCCKECCNIWLKYNGEWKFWPFESEIKTDANIFVKILTQCDKTEDQFEGFICHELKLYSEKFKRFDSLKKGFDEFYSTILIWKIDLSFLIKITLTLSYGQSALEKNFCISNSVPNVQIEEESIAAKTIVKSHISPRH